MENQITSTFGRGHLLQGDLEEIVRNSSNSLSALQSSRILIAGGTGFVGTWLVSGLLQANEAMNLELDVVVVTRNRERALSKLQPRPNDVLKVIESNLEFLSKDHAEVQSGFTHVIHGGNSTKKIEPYEELDTQIQIARKSLDNLIDIASGSSRAAVFMHLSSGAVYGPLARNSEHIDENWEAEGADPALDPYAYIKRMNESAVALATLNGQVLGTNPRLFAFCGPHLPLDRHFAIGDFMRAASRGEQIVVRGNPRTTRSYLYPTDLVEWLLAILVKPSLETLHVGSDVAFDMQTIAEKVSRAYGDSHVLLEGEEISPNHYVPDTTRTRLAYGLSQRISLEQGISRWKEWLSGK